MGAGLTGSLTANLLQKASKRFSVTIWEKSRGAGGRTTTHRDPINASLHVDIGAQYISRLHKEEGDSSDYSRLKETLYEEFISKGVLVPFQGAIEGERKDCTHLVSCNYVCPKGMNSIVKDLLGESKVEVVFQRRLLEASSESFNSGHKVVCTGEDNNSGVGGVERTFDALILTMPVPQLLQLKGNILGSSLDPELCSNLSSVCYSSRYALGLFYKEHIATSWSAKYFDNPIVRFASWDTAKRAASSSSSEGSTLLLHTSVPFGIEHLEEDKEKVKEIILRKADELIPDLPKPVHSHLIRWRYSQVSKVYPGSPGSLILSSNPLVVATGDGFTGSNFENCIRAALSTVTAVQSYYE